MSKESDLTNADRQKNYRDSQRAKGLVSRQMWVPKDKVEQVNAYVAKLQNEAIIPKAKKKRKKAEIEVDDLI